MTDLQTPSTQEQRGAVLEYASAVAINEIALRRAIEYVVCSQLVIEDAIGRQGAPNPAVVDGVDSQTFEALRLEMGAIITREAAKLAEQQGEAAPANDETRAALRRAIDSARKQADFAEAVAKASKGPKH